MSQANVEILRRLYERWGRGDFATPEAFDPQVEFVRIGDADDMTGAPGQWRGIDGLAAAVAEWTQEWEDVRFRAERFIEVGDRVLVLSRQTARGRRSGAPLDHAEADLFALRDGKIVRWEAYWDRATGMRALGLEG